MKVAINTRPLHDANKNRGVGSYTRNLINSLKKEVEVVEFQDLKQLKNVDIIHYPFFDLFLKTLPLIKKVPTVVTIHDVMPLVFSKNYPVGIRGNLNFQYQKITLKGVKKIITDSNVSKTDICKYLNVNPGKIDVIPLAAGEEFKVLSEELKKQKAKKLQLPKNYLLYVGDVNFIKNIPLLVKSFMGVKRKINSLKLVLVGKAFLQQDNLDHPELKSLKEVNQLIKENNLEDDVLRLGQVDILDLVAIYNLATVYIQPSLYEGFGIPVLEAMACGAPAVVSNVASLPEVAGTAALYFNPLSESDLAEKIFQLLGNQKLKQELVAQGLKRCKLFSWGKVADQTVKVYEGIL